MSSWAPGGREASRTPGRCPLTVPAPRRTYAAANGGARRLFGHVLDYQHRPLFVVALAHLDHS
jgi:hypothetical protein